MDEKKGLVARRQAPFFRRSQFAGRRLELIASSNPRLVKKAPTGAIVGADPARAARCEKSVIHYMVHVAWFYDLRPANGFFLGLRCGVPPQQTTLTTTLRDALGA